MPTMTGDRDHLYGLLALRMDFVSRDALRRALAVWDADTSRSLASILIALGELSQSRSALLDTLVDEQWKVHSNEGGPRSASDTSGSGLRYMLEGLLSSMGDEAAPPVDAYAQTIATLDGTRPPSPETIAPETDHADEPTEFGTVIGGDGEGSEGPKTSVTHRAPPGLFPEPLLPVHEGASSAHEIRYTILKHHARGGLGDVFIARDEELHREVALKEIQERHADRTDSRLRFLLEAEITGGLEHPGIVPVYGLGKYHDGRPYYAMRFIRGDTLRKAIDAFHEADEVPGRDPGERSLALRELLGRLVDVCNAIGYAHGRGVLHRDIKPGNIMLGRYGETLVVDWGLAKPVDRPDIAADPGEKPLTPASASGSSPTLLGSAVGTPQYMSPEQAAGMIHDLGPASDIYSLGATLYSILTGHSPFVDADHQTVLSKVRRGEFRPPRQVAPGTPPALEAICLKAMALAPADRHASTRLLAVDIELWLADEPVSAYREPFPKRARRWAKRHRTLVAAAGAVVLTGMVALAVSNVLIGRERDRTLVAKLDSDAKYALARGAVETMLDDLATIDLVDVPLMEPVRRRMLESALTFYREFLETRGDDPALVLDIGRAHGRLGDILEALGDYTPAEASYRTAIDALRPGAGTRPGARRSLASAELGLGLLLKNANRFPEANASLRASLLDRRAIVAPAGDLAEPRDLRERALTLYHLGALLARQKRATPEDEAIYREAIVEQRGLLPKLKGVDSDETRRDLARALNNLAYLLAGSDKAEAEAAYREALKLQLELEAASPQGQSYRWQAARTSANLGGLLLDSGDRLADALDLIKGSEGRFRRLVADFPKIPDYRQELAKVETIHAHLIRDSVASLARDAAVEALDRDALPLFRDAVARREGLVADFPARPDYVQSLATTLRDQAAMLGLLGKLDDARAMVDRALSLQTDLLSRFPESRHYDVELAGTLDAAAHLSVAAGRGTGAIGLGRRAVAAWERARESNPKSARVTRFLAEACAFLAFLEVDYGEPEAVFAAADRAAALLPDDPDELRRAARFYAMALGKVSPAGSADAEARAKGCVDLLNRAISAGFADPAEFFDPAYAPLKDRADFRAARRRLELKARPPAG